MVQFRIIVRKNADRCPIQRVICGTYNVQLNEINLLKKSFLFDRNFAHIAREDAKTEGVTRRLLVVLARDFVFHLPG